MPSRPRHDPLSKLWHLIVEEFPPALFVAAVVTLVNHETGLFDALNTYAFVAVGNIDAFSSQVSPLRAEAAELARNKNSPPVTVLWIDESRYADEYAETAPLSRCPLLRDIERIYAAAPAVLVIDLDISPALWLRKAAAPANNFAVGQCKTGSYQRQVTPECQAQCQEQLYARIKASPTPTVLMLPFGVSSLQAGLSDKRYAEWLERMQTDRVTFGDATLAIKFGVVLDAETGNDSIAEQTCRALNRGSGSCSAPREGEEHNINPRKYLDGTVNSVRMSDFAQGDHLRRRVFENVVFFGGGWDQSDRYMTPAGEVYGVEIHAASFASFHDHSTVQKPLAFLADVLLGIVLGLCTSHIWKRYFACRLSDDARRRQHGMLYVLLLVVLFIGFMVPIAVIVSYLLLTLLSVWASPVPVAIGMFVESFISGAVTQAIRAAYDGGHPLLPEANRGRDWLPGWVWDFRQLWNKVDDPHREPVWQSIEVIQFEQAIFRMDQPAQPAVKGKYRVAAMWLALRWLVRIVVVGWCLAIVFF